MHRLGLILCFVIFALTAAQAADGQVSFENNSSDAISISMDGRSICTLQAGASCSAPVPGDPSQQHTLRFERGGQSIDDSFSVSECPGSNSLVFFLRNDGTSADCD